MPEKKSTPDKAKIALIGSIIILIIVIGIGITSFYFGKKQGQQQRSPIPVIDLSSSSIPQVLGTEIYNWSGTVISLNIDDSKIVFQTSSRDTNGELQTTNITASINSSTQLFQWDLSRPPSDQASSNRTPIALSQFKAGQQVLVKANNDIDTQGEIEATTINLIIPPN